MFEITPASVVRPYEAIILLDPNASEDDQKALFQRNKKIIEGFKGEVAHVDTWGVRKLGNLIGKATRANYFHTTFTASPDSITELERTMRINEKVLRFMHTRLPETTVLTTYVETFKAALIDRKEKDLKRQQAKAKRPMR